MTAITPTAEAAPPTAVSFAEAQVAAGQLAPAGKIEAVAPVRPEIGERLVHVAESAARVDSRAAAVPARLVSVLARRVVSAAASARAASRAASASASSSDRAPVFTSPDSTCARRASTLCPSDSALPVSSRAAASASASASPRLAAHRRRRPRGELPAAAALRRVRSRRCVGGPSCDGY